MLIQLEQGGKNRRRGKNENEDDKRELVFREDGQGMFLVCGDLIEAIAFDCSAQNMHKSSKCWVMAD